MTTSRRDGGCFASSGAVLIGATIAEVVWALTYLAVGEAKPCDMAPAACRCHHCDEDALVADGNARQRVAAHA
jgi:hypothetical protein